jgi:hypothetical protein
LLLDVGGVVVGVRAVIVRPPIDRAWQTLLAMSSTRVVNCCDSRVTCHPMMWRAMSVSNEGSKCVRRCGKQYGDVARADPHPKRRASTAQRKEFLGWRRAATSRTTSESPLRQPLGSMRSGQHSARCFERLARDISCPHMGQSHAAASSARSAALMVSAAESGMGVGVVRVPSRRVVANKHSRRHRSTT